MLLGAGQLFHVSFSDSVEEFYAPWVPVIGVGPLKGCEGPFTEQVDEIGIDAVPEVGSVAVFFGGCQY